jgi:hypothetical protein
MSAIAELQAHMARWRSEGLTVDSVRVSLTFMHALVAEAVEKAVFPAGEGRAHIEGLVIDGVPIEADASLPDDEIRGGAFAHLSLRHPSFTGRVTL